MDSILHVTTVIVLNFVQNSLLVQDLHNIMIANLFWDKW